MIYNKKEFYGGGAMLVAFFVVLFVMFQPVFNGHNAMEYLDNLYNSISKGSINYIPQLTEEAAAFDAKTIDVDLAYDSEVEAVQAALLFSEAGAVAVPTGTGLKVSGSLGAILKASLDDSAHMYANDGDYVAGKYGLDARRSLYNWWTSLKLMDKGLKDQKEFGAAKFTATVQAKGVEAAYNYFGVEPVQIMDEVGMVAFSLVFYVLYTLWYGFAILFLFEGWGLKLSH